MNKSCLKFLLLSLFSVCAFLSCKREVDDITGNEDEKGIDQFIASDKLNTVESEKNALSEPLNTAIEINGSNFLSPDSIYKTTDSLARTKIELIINGSSITDTSTAETKTLTESAFAWIIKSVNNEPVANKDKNLHILYFKGKYLEYNNSLREASWGYFYIDSAITKIGFDFTNSSFKELYTIETLSESQLIFSKDDIFYEYEPYIVEGVKSNSFVPLNTPNP